MIIETEGINRPRLLISTVHPAPYMDALFASLCAAFDLDVFYVDRDSDEKSWTSFSTLFEGSIIKDMSPFTLYKRMNKSDFILVGGWSHFANVKLILMALVLGKSMAVFSDGPNLEQKSSMIRWVQSIVLNLLPIEFFVSGDKAGKIFADTYFIRDVSRIKNFPYHAWAPDKESLARSKETRQREISEGDTVTRVFVANRFIKRKGYEDIVTALYVLKEREVLERFSFHIAGTGEEFSKYQAIFESSFPMVKLHGWIETEEYQSHMLDCDVFIHASKFEPYGIPVIDACNCEKYIISTEGVCSAVDAKNAGYSVDIFQAGDGRALADSLQRFMLEIGTPVLSRSPAVDEGVFAPKKNIDTLCEALKMSGVKD